jgi:dipeptidyl aminopeptidase/acylaminoacyl peptidase
MTWSPYGQKIIFQNRDKSDLSSHSEIWVYARHGSDANYSHRSSARNLDSAWSPDGQKVAFDSNRDFAEEQIRQLFVMNADGSNQKSLTSLPGENGHAAGGRRLMWSRSRELKRRAVADPLKTVVPRLCRFASRHEFARGDICAQRFSGFLLSLS